ncbi:fibronectin type III domain-containing protein [Paenibacillus mucilaginosus]|uniref:Carbohydrate-binding family 9 n=1 Tax=Paenibacillus mucilaginosus (strain KNP414) TaxID=1036673 RepID=F8FQQ8_PAEMK|nr:fibronectin type III domain-containing protein [Paenibacillus mucilaginosus]AEI40413.1 Carbohydrate-binding family 9 [Paenibacillus mucilaginosus KNP414]MCG7213240.1 fibronectin type III domain-containing protein [Paenibacillus mucilaginosus]WDM29595.1 fibronectin type III domain-containing protein [Paenibacillus mucilaginosus]
MLMIKKGLAGLLFGLFLSLLLPSYVLAAGEVTVKINSIQVYEDTVYVKATISSASKVTQVKASVDHLVFSLYGSCWDQCQWEGYYENLWELTQGTKTLTVSAINELKQTGKAAQTFAYDKPPMLVLQNPQDGVITAGYLRVKGYAFDFIGPSEIRASVAGKEFAVDDTMVVNNMIQLDHTIDLTTAPEGLHQLHVQAKDTAGHVSEDTRQVLLVKKNLQVTDHVYGDILDFDSGRLLYLGYDEKLWLRDRSTGSETELYQGTQFVMTTLTSKGAAFIPYREDGQDIKLHLFVNGQTQEIPVSQLHGFALHGYGGDAALLSERYDDMTYVNLNTGEKIKTSWNPVYDGDFSRVFMTKDGRAIILNYNRLYEYDPASGYKLLAELNGEPRGLVSDGNTHLFEMYEWMGGDKYTTYIYKDGSLTVLNTQNRYNLSPFAVKGGWVAYVKLVAGVEQIFLRSPDGVEKQVTDAFDHAALEALAEDGSLMYRTMGISHYLPVGGESAVEMGTSFGVHRYVDNRLYKITEGTLAEVLIDSQPDQTAPYWPSPEPLTVSSVTYDRAELSWQSAMDDVGVSAYEIYKDGQKINTVSADVYAYAIQNLTPETTYEFEVKAVDGYGNVSTDNPKITVTTLPEQPPAATGLKLQVKPGYLDTGSTVELQVRAEQATDLYAFLTKLQFDPARFKLMQAKLSTDFGIEKSTAVLATSKGASGVVNWSGSLLGQVNGRTGSTGLLTLKFTVLQKGAGEFVLLEGSQTADSQGHINRLSEPVRISVYVGGADLDGDGSVTLSDLVLISLHSGTSEGQSGYDALYDLNNDHVINASDVQIVANKVAAAA